MYDSIHPFRWSNDLETAWHSVLCNHDICAMIRMAMHSLEYLGIIMEVENFLFVEDRHSNCVCSITVNNSNSAQIVVAWDLTPPKMSWLDGGLILGHAWLEHDWTALHQGGSDF